MTLTAEQTRYFQDRLKDPALSSRVKDTVVAALANPTKASVAEARVQVTSALKARIAQAQADRATQAKMTARREQVRSQIDPADLRTLEAAAERRDTLGTEARDVLKAIANAETAAPATAVLVAERVRRAANTGSRVRAPLADDQDTPGGTETLARLREPVQRRPLLAAAVSALGLTGTARAQTARAIDVLKTGDIAGALDVLAEQSPSPALRALARRLAPLMGEVEVRVVEVGRDYPPGYIHPSLHSAYGMVTSDRATGRTIMHIRVDPGAPDISNTTDETIVHEAIHAAIMSRLGSLSTYGAFITKGSYRTQYDFRDGYTPQPGDEHILQLLRLWSSLANTVRSSQTLRDTAANNPWLRAPATEPDEFITYALTSPEFQEWMKQQPLNREGYWTRFVRAVGGFLGFGARRPTYLDATLDASNALFDVLGQRRQGVAPQFQQRSDINGEIAFAHAAPAIKLADRDAGRLVTQASGAMADAWHRVGQGETRVGARRLALYLSTGMNAARVFGDLFPTPKGFTQTIADAKNLLDNIVDIQRLRNTISAKFAELVVPTWDAYERTPEAAQESIRWLMDAAAYKLDPRKTIDQHTWLVKEKNLERLKAYHAEARAKYNELKMRGHNQVFDNLARHNQMSRFAQLATLVHTIAIAEYSDTLPAGFETDPMREFLDSPEQVQNSPEKAHTYWKDKAMQRLAAGDALWRQMWQIERNSGETDPSKWTEKLEADKSPDNDPKASARVNLLGKTLRDMREAVQNLDRYPYFHLGRFGDYYASFALRTESGNETGPPDPKATEQLSAAMEAAGFDDFTFNGMADRPRVFLRTERADQHDNLMVVLNKLQAEGVIVGDIPNGLRAEASLANAADAKFLQDALQRLGESHIFDAPEGATKEEQDAANKRKNEALNQLREVWLSLMPATSEAKLMTERKVIQGWSKAMMDSYAFRANVGNMALANLATSAPMQATLSAMRRQLRDIERDPGATTQQKISAHQVLQEIDKREANHLTTKYGRDMFDTVRALNYVFYLGASVSYMLNNLTQVYVTLWPELAKKHGYVKAAKEIAKATGTAFKIVKAAVQEGYASTDPNERLRTRARRAAEPNFTASVFDAAGVPADLKPFLLRLVNKGVVDIGGAARELGRLAQRNTNEGVDNLLRYAGAAGLYSEAVVRLASGIALHNLEKQSKGSRFDETAAVNNAVRVIDETMFNYTEANVGRALGREGLFGRFTPIFFAFQQFNAQMLEKLYREIDAAIAQQRPGDALREDGTTETDSVKIAETAAQRRREARKFLGGHAAAITVLAGSLGLPGATAVAAAVNKLTDMFDDDDEPYDLAASYRNFLSSMLGKDLGEVVARGAPRALGLDTSSRLGEQDIIPLSRFFADRRDFSEAAKDQAFRMLGAPTSMFTGMATGIERMAQGRVLDGMVEMMPAAFRGGAQAFRMGQEGYVNDRGVRLPLEPGARDMLVQAIGYTPSNLAEYREANFAQQSRRAIITREASGIRSQIMRALETGDQTKARELIAEAREFDRNNPAFAILPRLGSSVQARALDRAQAQAVGVPLGVSMRDVAARDRTAFANY